jgi:hypothetical protein
MWWVGGTASYIGQGLFEAGVQLPLAVIESWDFCISHNVSSMLEIGGGIKFTTFTELA